MATALKAEPTMKRPQTPPWLDRLSSFASSAQNNALQQTLTALTELL
jgi:hypothetical protein